MLLQKNLQEKLAAKAQDIEDNAKINSYIFNWYAQADQVKVRET